MANYKFYVDDAPIGRDELLSVLGIDPAIIKKKSREFEINPDRVRKDSHGNPKFPKSLGITTRFTAFNVKEKRNVDVRIAEFVGSRNLPNGHTQKSYFPGQLFINGQFKKTANDDEFLWFMIHPNEENSTLRETGKGWRYRFMDKEAAANKKVDFRAKRARAEALIAGDHALTINQLRQIAKGMNVDGVDNLSHDEVRDALFTIADRNPIDFYEKAKSPEIIFNGVVQDAIDKEKLYLRTDNGLRKWYFEEEELAIVPSSSDATKIIRDTVAERAHELIPKIKDALLGNNAKEIIKSGRLDGLFEDFNIKEPDAPLTAEEIALQQQKQANMDRHKLKAQVEKYGKYFEMLDMSEEQLKEVNHNKVKAFNENRDYIKSIREQYNASLETV